MTLLDNIRQRAATADAPRGDSIRLALGVGTPTLPPVHTHLLQDDGRFRFSAELFIVSPTFSKPIACSLPA
jgi:hypothetical protein